MQYYQKKAYRPQYLKHKWPTVLTQTKQSSVKVVRQSKQTGRVKPYYEYHTWKHVRSRPKVNRTMQKGICRPSAKKPVGNLPFQFEKLLKQVVKYCKIKAWHFLQAQRTWVQKQVGPLQWLTRVVRPYNVTEFLRLKTMYDQLKAEEWRMPDYHSVLYQLIGLANGRRK